MCFGHGYHMVTLVESLTEFHWIASNGDPNISSMLLAFSSTTVDQGRKWWKMVETCLFAARIHFWGCLTRLTPGLAPSEAVYVPKTFQSHFVLLQISQLTHQHTTSTPWHHDTTTQLPLTHDWRVDSGSSVQTGRTHREHPGHVGRRGARATAAHCT